MAIAVRDGKKILIFDLKEMGVNPENWRRLCTNIRSRKSVSRTELVQNETKLGDHRILVVTVQPSGVPEKYHDQWFQELHDGIANAILHRASNPDRLTSKVKKELVA